jgi:uncharacterized UPF0160 family protein
MQQKYWNMLTQSKFELYYLDEHFRHCVRLDRWVKILLAVLSANSVAGWAIWSSYAKVWGAIIAVSQVILIVNDYLPYQKRVSEICKLRSSLMEIYLKMENRWRDVQAGELTDDEINDLRTRLLKAWSGIEEKHFTDDALPERKMFIKRANVKKNTYFERFLQRTA